MVWLLCLFRRLSRRTWCSIVCALQRWRAEPLVATGLLAFIQMELGPQVQWNFDTPCLKEAEQPPMILSKVPQVQSEAPYETISSQAPARSRECLHPRWLFVASWDGEFAHRLACFSACRYVRPVRRSWSIVFGSCTVLTPVAGSLWSGWLLLPARLFLKLIRWQPRE